MSNSPDERLLISVRDATVDDRGFIFDTWRNTYKFAKPRSWEQGFVFQRFMTDRMNRLFKRATVKVATFPDHSDDLIGWVCAEAPLLHYVFTKKVYQNQGVARRLLTHAGITGCKKVYCTHWTLKKNKLEFADYITFINCEV